MNPSHASTPHLLADDLVLPFYLEHASVNGRIVRLGPVLDHILKNHDYPDAVSHVLGEGIALTLMLSASIKFDGRLILQTSSNGPIDLMVVQVETPGSVRGYARFDKDFFADSNFQDARLSNKTDQSSSQSHGLLGKGHLAMTIDQGPDMDRYQGIVALENGALTDTARTYFRQSEQLPTFLHLAVAKHYQSPSQNADTKTGIQTGPYKSTPPDTGWSWRAGGLMVQDLTREGGRQSETEASATEDDSLLDVDNSENWQRATLLTETLEDHELLDPMLETERLLYRLFHEERVRVFESRAVAPLCTCSQDHIRSVLSNFTKDEHQDMLEEDGRTIGVTCEFCSKRYAFDVNDFASSQ